MALRGIDVSSWQEGIDIAAVPCDFVIAKATGGNGYVNPDCDRVMQQAFATGKKAGFYAYAREKGYEDSATAEADFFIDNCAGYFGRAIPVLDWEEDTALGVEWAKAWLDRVRERTGAKPLIYMSKSVCRSYDWSPVVAADYGLWYAQYADSEPTGYQDKPWTDGGGLGAWPFAAMFQYASTGRLDGWSGNLDLNIFYGDASAWDAYAEAKAQQPAPQPVKKSVDEVAHEVIGGSWGNGGERRARMEAAGYPYETVQARVNEILGTGARAYTVVSGDTLSGIGAKLGIDWRAIASLNGIESPYTIYPGDKLTY